MAVLNPARPTVKKQNHSQIICWNGGFTADQNLIICTSLLTLQPCCRAGHTKFSKRFQIFGIYCQLYVPVISFTVNIKRLVLSCVTVSVIKIISIVCVNIATHTFYSQILLYCCWLLINHSFMPTVNTIVNVVCYIYST